MLKSYPKDSNTHCHILSHLKSCWVVPPCRAPILGGNFAVWARPLGGPRSGVAIRPIFFGLAQCAQWIWSRFHSPEHVKFGGNPSSSNLIQLYIHLSRFTSLRGIDMQLWSCQGGTFSCFDCSLQYIRRHGTVEPLELNGNHKERKLVNFTGFYMYLFYPKCSQVDGLWWIVAVCCVFFRPFRGWDEVDQCLPCTPLTPLQHGGMDQQTTNIFQQLIEL